MPKKKSTMFWILGGIVFLGLGTCCAGMVVLFLWSMHEHGKKWDAMRNQMREEQYRDDARKSLEHERRTN